jgi:hypothetical protein
MPRLTTILVHRSACWMAVLFFLEFFLPFTASPVLVFQFSLFFRFQVSVVGFLAHSLHENLVTRRYELS